MPRSPSKKGAAARSASRGRPAGKKAAPKSPKTPKTPKTPAKTPTKTRAKTPVKTPAKSATKKKTSVSSAPANNMDFSEGDNVMARWPGTSLYFKAKVTFVREDDNEYDVLYEDGTTFTIKAKDVKNAAVARKMTPSRSASRGRSPSRKKATPASTAKASAKASPGRRTSRSSTRKSVSMVAPKPEATPTRTSARLAAAKVELSSDEDDGPKAIPNPSHPRRGKRGFFSGFDFGWLQALFFMALCPAVLLALHLLCPGRTCKLAAPVFPKKLDAYWNQQAFLSVLAFPFVVRYLSFLPIGAKVRTNFNKEVRMNGFFCLLAVLAVMPALVYRKVDLSFVTKNYFFLMTSSLLLSVVLSLVYFVAARWGRRTNANPKGNTGNFIVDFFYGREFNPYILDRDSKLQLYRMSVIGLAVLNVVLVLDSINSNKGAVNPAVIIAAAFQVVYSFDAMFFEEYFYFSHDAMNVGTGFSLVSSYLTFPFVPTLITRYMIANSPVLPWYHLLGICFMNALGYVIFRASETQRCEFIKNPNQASFRNLETISTAGGRKIPASGWWGLVRHPNYLGEMLMQWSWVMPAVKMAGRADLLVYYLPIFTTLTLLVRVRDQNTKNKRKFGHAWNVYCERVKSNLIPKVY